MLQQPEPDDYVVATAETHTVREFVEIAFALAGLDYRKYVVLDPLLYRPAEVNVLLGNAAKACQTLGWSHETGFEAMVGEMVANDMRAVGLNDRLLADLAGKVSATAGSKHRFEVVAA